MNNNTTDITEIKKKVKKASAEITIARFRTCGEEVFHKHIHDIIFATPMNLKDEDVECYISYLRAIIASGKEALNLVLEAEKLVRKNANK